MQEPIRLVVDGPIARSDIPGLCARVGRLLRENDAEQVICDVGALRDPDAATVDALAQLQLEVLRYGRSIEVHHASIELRALFALMGLSEVVRLVDDLGAAKHLRLQWEPEQREQPRGVEEEVEPDDAAT